MKYIILTDEQKAFIKENNPDHGVKPSPLTAEEKREAHNERIADRLKAELKQQNEQINLQSGIKHDNGKIDLSLLTRASLEAEASALMFGAEKYGRHNFREGFDNVRLLAAAMRHIVAYNDGEDNDLESGLSHLNHAKACLGMLITNIADGKSVDKRYKGPKKDN